MTTILENARRMIAGGSTLEEGESFTTLELRINFLKTARLVAEGIVVQRGKTVGVSECSVSDERGRLIAKATSRATSPRRSGSQSPASHAISCSVSATAISRTIRASRPES